MYVTIGFVDNTTNKDRYDIATHFGIFEKKEMRDWVWFHFITNASLMVVAPKVGLLSSIKT